MTSRRRFLTTGGLAMSALLISRPAMAAKDPIYTSWGLAIKGTDPVAYFTENQPVKGKKEHSFIYQGAEFRFASAENKALFVADPEAYAPQYGGYCAWAVSLGYTASIVPEAFRIVDGKLYLNYSLRVQAQWEADRDNRIILANQNWPAVLER